MTDRSVAVRLKAEVAGFNASIASARAQVSSFNKELGPSKLPKREALDQIGKGFLGIGAAAGVGVGIAVKSFADFDQAMSAVKAATHETAGNMKSLREAAIKAGAATKYSATEAAGGIENLAKAGISTKDILAGGLSGALDLASAGGLDVADAAETAATALTQFKLKGSDVPHVADLLAAAAGKAQGEVSDMAQALNQGGLVAAQMGLSIEETTGALAAFASAGLLGSDAGTSLKTMLLRLANPSKEAAAQMEQLGIHAYDAQGKFVGLQDLAGQLQTAFQGQSQATRDAALSTIFGSDAIRAASILYADGAAGIADWTKKVNDQGYAAETAAIKMDNLKGDLEQLKGSLETAFIGLGESSNGPLRSMLQNLTDLVNKFNDLPSGAKEAVLAVGGVIAIAGTLGGAMLILLPKIAAADAAIRSMTKGSLGLKGALGGLAKAGVYVGAFEAIAAGIGAIYDESVKAQNGTDALRLAIIKFGRGGQTADLSGLGQNFADLKSQIDELTDPGMLRRWEDFDSTVSGALTFGAFGDTSGSMGRRQAIDDIKSLDAALAGLVQSGNASEAGDAFAKFGLTAQQAAEFFPQYQDALKGVQVEAANTAPPVQALTDETSVLEQTSQDAAQSVSDLKQAILDLTSPTLDLRSTTREFEAAIDDASASLEKNGRTLNEHTEKGRANQAALDAIATAANGVTGAMAENGASQEALQSHLATSRKAFEDTAVRMGMSKKAAHALAEQVIQIPDAKTIDVTVKDQAAAAALKTLAQLLAPLSTGANIPISVSGVAAALRQLGTVSTAAHQAAVDLARQGRHATGGYIAGPGTGTSDSIPAYLSNGEFVINAKATSRHLPLLEAINAGRYASGGRVGFASGGRARMAPVPFIDPAMFSALGIDVGKQLADAFTQGFTSATDGARSVAEDVQRIVHDSAKSAADDLASLQRQAADYAKSVTGHFLELGSITRLATSGPQSGSAFDYVPGKGLVDVTQQVNLIGGLEQAVAQTKQFGGLIKTLKGRGLRQDLLSQLLDTGAQDGLSTAQALAGLDKGTLAHVNSLQAQLVGAGSSVGSYASNLVYGSQVSAAQVASAQAAAIERAVDKATAPMVRQQVEMTKQQAETNRRVSGLAGQIARALSTAASSSQHQSRNLPRGA